MPSSRPIFISANSSLMMSFVIYDTGEAGGSLWRGADVTTDGGGFSFGRKNISHKIKIRHFLSLITQ